MRVLYAALMKRSYPEEQLRKMKKRRRLHALKLAVLGTFTLFTGSLLLYHFYDSLFIGLNILFILIIAFFIISILAFVLMFHYLKQSKKEAQLKSGVEGERLFKKYLEKIEGYKFYSLPLPHGGDIDALLVNKSGVFAFEVKNYSGIIKCVGDNWQRTKVGKGGGHYQGHVGNPSEEARRHARDLQNYLRARGIQVDVTPVVVITHTQARIDGSQCSVRVIKPQDAKTLVSSNEILTEWELKQIAKEIKRLANQLA